MSRPRTPFGTDLPGRLPATMLRVLAAEMSDAARLARGKRYWSDQAVIDLHVGPGVATAEVQGSRRSPYVAVLRVGPGSGAPSRRDVDVACSCPDDDGTGIHACKHVVAALFALADEVSIEPEVLQRWRGGRPARDDRGARRPHGAFDDEDEDESDELDEDVPGLEGFDEDANGGVDTGRRSWGSGWSSDRRSIGRPAETAATGSGRTTGTERPGRPTPPPPAMSPLADELAGLLGERDTPLPAPIVTPLSERPPFPDPLVTAAVEEAIARLALEW